MLLSVLICIPIGRAKEFLFPYIFTILTNFVILIERFNCTPMIARELEHIFCVLVLWFSLLRIVCLLFQAGPLDLFLVSFTK